MHGVLQTLFFITTKVVLPSLNVFASNVLPLNYFQSHYWEKHRDILSRLSEVPYVTESQTHNSRNGEFLSKIPSLWILLFAVYICISWLFRNRWANRKRLSQEICISVQLNRYVPCFFSIRCWNIYHSTAKPRQTAFDVIVVKVEFCFCLHTPINFNFVKYNGKWQEYVASTSIWYRIQNIIRMTLGRLSNIIPHIHLREPEKSSGFD